MNPFRQKATGGDGGDLHEVAQRSPLSHAKRLPTGTDQQDALWTELTEGTSNILVEARAGSGKSASAREGMWRMLDRRPGLAGSIRYAVFNKQNATEFQADCPFGVEAGTVHSFGYAALRRTCNSRVEKNKTYLILDESREGKAMPRYYRKSVAMLVGQAKNQGIQPNDPEIIDRLGKIIDHYDINAYGRGTWVAEHAAAVLARSASWVELCDFDDMIWLPGVLGLEFPACEVLFLDEVQDWCPAQHILIPQLCRSGRVVALGDRFQAVYAFRGADADSIPRLERLLGTSPVGVRLMPLTVTWRCPRSHVALAQHYVPDLQARREAQEGTVLHVGDGEAVFHPGDMVLCPTNAPLVSEALHLVGQRRKVIVRGRAVGDSLVSIVRGVGEVRTIADLAKGVEAWRSRELSRLSDLDGVDDLVESAQDRAAGVQAVLSTCDSPAQVEGAIALLFSDNADPASCPDAVIFSTVHRAKGLEANNIHLLEVPRRATRLPWEYQQQRNLRYVALTRSKNRLVFVHPDNGNEGDDL